MLKILASRTLAVIFLSALVIFLVISTAFPQASRTPEEGFSRWKAENPSATTLANILGLFDAYSSWVFLALLGALALNLLACTFLRAFKKGNLRSYKRAGSLIFHFSMVIIAAGGLWSFLTRMDAALILTERQSVDLSEAGFVSFRRGPLAPGKFAPATLKLVKFTPTYEDKKYLTRMGSRLDFSDGRGETGPIEIEVNEPGSVGGCTLTQDKFGFAPRLVISGHHGPRQVDAHIALKTFETGGRKTFTDFLRIPPTGETLYITLFPDYVNTGEGHASRSELPENPYLLLKLAGKDGTGTGEKLVRAGSRATIGSFQVLFAGLRYWSAFRLVKDRGLWIIYVGFIVSLVGLALRFGGEIARGVRWK